MNRRTDASEAAASSAAIEMVLRAERDADAEVTAHREEAARRIERAREAGLAEVNRALARARGRQERHAQALAARIATLRTRAAVLDGTSTQLDDAGLEAAVARLAARLTGAAEGSGGGCAE